MDVELTTEAGQIARDALADTLAIVPPQRIPGVDSQNLAVGLTELLRSIDAEEQARFAAFDGLEGFKASMLDTLALAAQALWLVASKRAVIGGGDSARASLTALAQDGMALRSRIIKSVIYNLGDDPEVTTTIDKVRVGRGYRDLADDLQVLARLCTEHAAALADDRRFDPAAPREAEALAARILALITQDSSADDADLKTEAHRLHALIRAHYGVVRALAQFILRDDPSISRFKSTRRMG